METPEPHGIFIYKAKSIKHSQPRNKLSPPTITTKTGYRSILCAKTKEPKITYFEAEIINKKGYARIGMATKNFEPYGPIGMDSIGYSIGNKNGYGFHQGKRIFFGERWGINDIVSVLKFNSENKIKLKFFINGISVPKYFCLTDEEFWPAFSVYNGCVLSINLGPNFKYKEAIFTLENLVDEPEEV